MTSSALAWTGQVLAPDYAFQTLQIETLTLKMDENWAPYTQATLVVNWNSTLELLNPEGADIYVQLTATQTFGRSLTLDDLSALYTAKTLDDLSTIHSGQTLDTLSTLHSVGFEGGTPAAPVTRSWLLVVREIEIDYLASTVRLSLASPEARLQDYALVQTGDLNPPATYTLGMSPRQPVVLVNYVLALIGEELYSWDNLDDTQYFTTAQMVWKPGVSAFDYLYPLLKKVGLMLYARFDGKFVLRYARYYGETPPTLTLNTTNLKTATTVKSRELDYYTAAVITYNWKDSAGTLQTAVDAYDSGLTPKRVYTETAEVPFPGAGVAQSVLSTMRQTQRVLEATAVANLAGTWLAGNVNLTHARGTFTGYLKAVELQHPSDEMSVTIRQGT